MGECSRCLGSFSKSDMTLTRTENVCWECAEEGMGNRAAYLIGWYEQPTITRRLWVKEYRDTEPPEWVFRRALETIGWEYFTERPTDFWSSNHYGD